MLLTIASALLPILFVVALGYASVRFGIIDSKAAGIFSKFVVDFALPLSLFIAAAKAKPSDLIYWGYLVFFMLGFVGSFAVAFACGRALFKHDQRTAAVQGLASTFPNLAYCGPPVLGAVVGPSGILAVLVGNLVLTVVVIPLTLVLIGGQDGGQAQASKAALLGRSVLGAVEQPLVWLPLIGVAFALSGLHLPDLAVATANEIGSAAGGVALFTLGLMLAGLQLRLDREVAINVAIKNLLQPALLLGVAFVLGLHGSLGKEVFLVGVLPTATLVPALAHTSKAYESQAPLTVMASTLFSIVTITVGIAIAEKLP